MAKLLPSRYSFRLVSGDGAEDSIPPVAIAPLAPAEEDLPPDVDHSKRNFLKVAGLAGLGLVASQMLPKGASAYVMGSSPTSNVVGVKDSTDARVDPATDSSVLSLLSGQGVTKLTTSLTSSGPVYTPGSGKKVRVYSTRFTLSADMTDVSFRFGAAGTDYEKYLGPKNGGLYGANNHPNYVEGGVNDAIYCVMTGTGTLQINVDYLEV